MSGETLIELRARAETFWSELLSQSKHGQRILIISHGQMIAMLFLCFLKLPTDESIQLKTGDTGIHCWRIDEKEKKIVFTNSCEHLQIMLTKLRL
jgi:broad specificity phosphatase PhoE